MKYYISLILFILTFSGIAQEGELDFSFNGSGKIIYDVNNQSKARCVVLQPDGKILIGGSNSLAQGNMLIIRYDLFGNPDVTFGIQGIANIDLNGDWQETTDFHILPDGKIIVLAESEHGNTEGCAIVRLTANGQLDQSFADSGWVFMSFGSNTSYWPDVEVLPDGTILAGGYGYVDGAVRMLLVNFNPDGSRNLSFGDTGVVAINASGTNITTQLKKIIQLPGNKMLIGGTTYSQGMSTFFAIRLNNDGTPDPSFAGGNSSIVSFNENATLYSAAMQRDGKILLAGETGQSNNREFAVSRLNPDGTLDQNFGVNGKVTTIAGPDSKARFIGVLGDDRIIVGGHADGIWNQDFALARYKTDGSLDNSFSFDGFSTKNIGAEDDEVYAGALQSDGKLILVGVSDEPNNSSNRFNLSAARFIGGQGSIELEEFDKDSFQIFPNPANDLLNIYAETLPTSLKIINMEGQILLETHPTSKLSELRVDDLPNGVYQLIVEAKDHHLFCQKLVVSH